jgi:hypothetical protein
MKSEGTDAQYEFTTTGPNDLPPASRTSLKLVKSVNHQENDGHEEEQIH